MAVNIISRKIPIYAKEHCTVSTNNIQDWCNINCLLQDGLSLIQYGTLEKNFFRLDNSFTTMSDINSNYGYYSKTMSDTNGNFETPIEIEFTFDQTYNSNGITIWFDYFNNIFPTYLKVIWYNNDVEISSTEQNPTSFKLFVNNNVDNFNKIKIIFYKLNAAKRYLRIFRIDFGESYIFTDDDIAECKLLEEINIDRTSMPSNSLEFVINSNNTAQFRQDMQIDIFKNDTFFGTFFVNEVEKKDDNQYRVYCLDILYNITANDITKEQLFSVINSSNRIDVIKTFINNFEIIDCDINHKAFTVPASTPREIILLMCLNDWVFLDCSRNNKIKIQTENTIVKEINSERIKETITKEEETKYNGVCIKTWEKRYEDYYNDNTNFGQYVFTDSNDTVLIKEYNIPKYLSGMKAVRATATSGGNRDAKFLGKGLGWYLYGPYSSTYVGDKYPYTIYPEFEGTATEKLYYKQNNTIKGSLYQLDIKQLSECLVDIDTILNNLYNNYIKDTGTEHMVLSFDMIIKDEVCGDLIQIDLPKIGTVKGIIQYIYMDLKTPKNIATVEVFI